MRSKFAALLAGSSLLAIASPALAQDASEDEIVVTGTLIRGVQATGSQTLALDSEAIAQEGALSTNELLASIPQIGQFNGNFEGDSRGVERGITINRPNLRSLPGFNSASGSVTLVLMDGHRVTPVGINESSIDVDVIPSAVVQRVEVVTDGGSSIYGADAVAGVINFVTRRDFEGIQLDANYGFGDSIDGFEQYDTQLTAGTSWQSGNAYISVGASHRDLIRNGDQDWARMGVWQPDGTLAPVDTQCRTPVSTEFRWFWVDIGGGFYTSNPLAPGAGEFAAPGQTPCDQFAEGTLLPEQDRENAFLSVSQELAPNIDLRVTSYYTHRSSEFVSYPLGFASAGTLVTPPPQPPGTPTGTLVPQFPFGTSFSFGASPADPNYRMQTDIETFGIQPELIFDLGNDWQVRNTLVYGQSYNSQTIPRVNNAAALAAISGATLDPLNVAGAAPSVILNILDWEDAVDTNQEMFDYRVVADGPVFTLPAGPVRAAVGFEFADTRVESRANTGTRGSISGVAYDQASRDVYSFFGEVSVPVIPELDLALSVRYDDYSDFGDTTNPNLGFDFHPWEWLSVYGHWGKSFNAPTAIDQFAIATAVYQPNISATQIEGVDVFDNWDVAVHGGRNDILQATGESGNLGPQTSEQWALGAQIEPLEGLRFNVNYFRIDFSDILGALNPTSEADLRANPDKIIWLPNQAQLDDFIATLSNAEDLQALSLNADDFAFIIDRITSNLSQAHISGLDFGVSYTHDTDFGTFDFGVAGTYTIDFEVNNVDRLKTDQSDLSLQGVLGWRNGPISSRVTVNYTDGFDTGVGQNGQTKVDGYAVTNLFLGYDLPEGLFGADTSLRLNVDNVFDEDPPLWRRNASQPAFSGFTLGRVIQVGVTTRF